MVLLLPLIWLQQLSHSIVTLVLQVDLQELLCCCNCEWESDVVAVVAPLSGVTQVVSHGVKVVGVHGEEGKKKDEEMRVEVKGEIEENQRQPLIMDGMRME